MGEKKQGSGGAAKRSKPTGRSAGRKASSKRAASGAAKDQASNAGNKKPRRAAPKKEKKTSAVKKKSLFKKLAPGSGTPPMAEEESNITADASESQAERRTAGGTENQATAKPEASVLETSVDKAGRDESKPVSQAARKPVGDKRVKPGDTSEPALRPNTLVPTNSIHTTERRLKRRLPQNRVVMFMVAATLLGILFIGEQTEPPDMTSVEAQIAAGQAGHARAETDVDAPGETTQPRVQNPVEGPSAGGQRVAATGAETGNPISEPQRTGGPQERTVASEAPPDLQAWDMDGDELVEMERMLARLDLAPSTVDGIVDQQTRHAIRLYQQIAGLPIDGEPSPGLLMDMREVVKILEGGDG